MAGNVEFNQRVFCIKLYWCW